MTRTLSFSAACLAALAACVAALGLASFSGAPGMTGAGTEWPVSGGDADGRYYSGLTAINDHNVDRLGYAWSYDLGTTRGQEATPLVIGGVMYAAGLWGNVYALNARTGAPIWHYDPQVPGQWGRNACCDVVNRGVAYRDGVVFVASEDGRLHAIDARTGKARWIADTIIDHKQPYASTGGVLLTRDAVVIGNAGADMGDHGLRGYVSAWDIRTGKFKWRFFTVPPPPGQPFEHPEMKLAAMSWGPDRTGRYQNGGTVWDGLSYDPETHLIIFGTGNAAPYLQSERSRTTSDDLFNASIVAVRAGSGRMAWYYQETPGDQWDYDAVQKFIFATLPIGGAPRKVVMQASKNGFFYVLDRANGKLLSANAFTYVNWATGVDLKNGRPTVTDVTDYTQKPKNIYPSAAGGHTWNPMSFDPATGLVYIPTIDAPNLMISLNTNGGAVHHLEGAFSTAGVIPDESYDPGGTKRTFGPLPDLAGLQDERKGVKLVREILKAWDPVAGKVVWQQVTSSGFLGWDGGVLTTAGNLVFQGRGDGHLWVYDARTGKPLKDIDTGSHIMAAPMTYSIDGEQYVAVQTGYGGAGVSNAIPPTSAAYARGNENRILVFKLGGGPTPMPPVLPEEPFPAPPPFQTTLAEINHGEEKFTEQCSRCHVFGHNITQDLSKLPPGVHDQFDDIVLHGVLAPVAMADFSDVITPADAHAIHAYLIALQRRGYAAQMRAQAKAAGR